MVQFFCAFINWLKEIGQDALFVSFTLLSLSINFHILVLSSYLLNLWQIYISHNMNWDSFSC